MAERAMDHPAG